MEQAIPRDSFLSESRAAPGASPNCGPHEEPFSFHSGGCNVVMVDGCVRFVNDRMSPLVLRALVTRSGR